MALEVISEIKAAEEAALETRRVALAAAKESLKMAEQENAAYREQVIAEARLKAAGEVAQAQQESRKKLEERQAQRFENAGELRKSASVRLEKAAKLCVERILN
jgi:hypothetical protein